jgi:ATP-dependent protease ClpP protease subunit
VKRWFDFRAQAKGAEIAIYDEIGAFGIPAKAFLDELKALGSIAELTVRINSPGGSVFDGVAIYNALKRHDAAITVWVDGIAAAPARHARTGARGGRVGGAGGRTAALSSDRDDGRRGAAAPVARPDTDLDNRR